MVIKMYLSLNLNFSFFDKKVWKTLLLVATGGVIGFLPFRS